MSRLGRGFPIQPHMNGGGLPGALIQPFGGGAGPGFPTYSNYVPIRRLIDPAKYETDAPSYFEANLATSVATAPSYARLFNITDAVAVAGSAVSSTSTSADGERVRSGPITLSGSKEYRAQRGGPSGEGTYKCFSADAIVESS